MTTGIIHVQNTEIPTDKHMGGCIGGFFNFFDRSHVISGKRLYPKRLPPSSGVDSESGSSIGSPAVSKEFDRSRPRESAKSAASPDRLMIPATPPRSTVQDSPARVSSFDYKESLKSPSKFPRDLPRLSLDSRLHPRGIRTTSAAVEGAGDDESERQRRSPSVVARLMGLELLPPPLSGGGDLPEKKVELRRSASESRSRDLLHSRFVDGNILPANAQYRSNLGFATSETREKSNGGRYLTNLSNCNINERLNGRTFDHGGYIPRNASPEPSPKPPRRINAQQQLSKGLYDYGDFFPEPKPTVSSKLKIRGIEEPSMDLETLKQILESLHLKGLLHHSKVPTVSASQIGRRNFVYERRLPYEESPIVVMKPARSPRRLATEPSPPRFQSKTNPRRNLNLSLNITGGDSFSPRSTRSPTRNPNPTSPGRIENRRGRKVPLNVETTPTETRRVSPVQSPRIGSRRLDQTASQSPRRRKSTAEVRSVRAEDESSTISESSFSTSSRTDTEKSKMEESYKDGKSLLERCNKLLNTIAEMNSITNSSTELQQSPVSVLDSSLYKEEESPSPVMKRAIDFKDLEDEIWCSSSSGEGFLLNSSDADENVHNQQDPDFAYVSEIIRALNYLSDDTDVFSLLEKHQSIKGSDTSKSSRLHRRLIFDTITEILGRNKQLPPWKSTPCEPQSSEIWSELQRIQKRDESDDMFEVICGVMKRDLTRASTNGWSECNSELSEAVLDIERLIFKDLIGETIHDLVGLARTPCRKLLF